MNQLSKKVFETLLFFLILTFISFLVVKLAPGDPVRNILGVDDLTATAEQIEALREELGLNKPIIVQYGMWLGRLVQLDLGQSVMTHKSVVSEIASAFPATLILTFSSLFVMLLMALPLGILAALYRDSFIDKFANGFSLFGTSIPGFWLGLIIIDLFAVRLKLFPAMGIGGISHLVLPSLTLGISMAPPYIRLLRASIIESKQKDFVRAARARGIDEKSIFFFHIFRDSLLPVVTVFGVSLGSLLGGTVITEVIFGYPGLGKLAIEAIVKRDYAVIQGFILFMGVMVFIINTLLDRSYRWINPAIVIKEVEQR